MATTRVITDDDLLRLPKDGNKYEVVEGELRVSPAGWAHERVVAHLIAALHTFARKQKLGDVLGSNVLYVLPSGNKRAPDVSFVATGRIESQATASPFPQLAPDLAAEVVSPGETPRQVLDKVGEYLEAGVRLVWIIDPEKRRAVVYRSLTETREVEEAGALDGEDVVPGFRLALSVLFE